MELTKPALCALAFEGVLVIATMAVKTTARPSVKYLFMQTPSKIRGNFANSSAPGSKSERL
jgi:hypothetical protein